MESHGNFCINYEQARKHDIDITGKDHECHKNDEKLKDATLCLDEQSLRQLFASVGLADRDGIFPINALIEESENLHHLYKNDASKNIEGQLSLLSKFCPEFATCQNSSMTILSDILLNSENLKFDKCVTKRVYNKDDSKKRPVLFVFASSDELGTKFYFASKEEGRFVELTQEEFTKKFECYEQDLKRSDNIRPWETKKQLKEEINLSRSSGKIASAGSSAR